MTDHLNWYALLTRSNFENTVQNSINKKNYQTFLPKTKKKSIRKDRNKMIEIPLFKGYIFVKTNLEPQHQLNILKTTGAVRLLGNQSEPVPIPTAQIESLKILTSASMDLITGVNIRLKTGDPVMILQGPMAGIKGEFIQYKGQSRVVIKIDALGQYAGVDVEEENVEKLPDFSA